MLHQIELRHTARLALKFRRRDAYEFSENIPGVVEGQRLVEIAGEQVTLQMLFRHMDIRFNRPAKDQLKALMEAIFNRNVTMLSALQCVT